MFDNIGGKIKTLAEATCVLGILGSVIWAIATLMQSDYYHVTILESILILGLGSLGSWVGSFITYGFGELIENTTRIHEDNLELQKILTLQKRQVIQSRKMNHLKCIKLIARQMKLCVLYVAKFKNLTGSCAGIVELISRMNNNNI